MQSQLAPGDFYVPEMVSVLLVSAAAHRGILLPSDPSDRSTLLLLTRLGTSVPVTLLIIGSNDADLRWGGNVYTKVEFSAHRWPAGE